MLLQLVGIISSKKTLSRFVARKQALVCLSWFDVFVDVIFLCWPCLFHINFLPFLIRMGSIRSSILIGCLVLTDVRTLFSIVWPTIRQLKTYHFSCRKKPTIRGAILILGHYILTVLKTYRFFVGMYRTGTRKKKGGIIRTNSSMLKSSILLFVGMYRTGTRKN